MAKRKQMVNPVDLIASINPFSTAAEQYRKIRTNIEFSSADKKIKLCLRIQEVVCCWWMRTCDGRVWR